MKKEGLENLGTAMEAEVAKRRTLGGYSTDAETILALCETVLRLIDHAIVTFPKEKKK